MKHKIWNDLIEKIFLSKNKSDLNKLIGELEDRYEISFKPEIIADVENKISKLISKMQKQAKRKRDDTYYDLQILQLELKPHPKSDNQFVIDRKIECLKYKIGNIFSMNDVESLETMVEFYTHKNFNSH